MAVQKPLVVDNGTTQVLPTGDQLEVDAGTAAAPALTINGDPNTGIYSPGADQLSIATGGAQRMVVDASGNVAIGSPTAVDLLTVWKDQNAGTNILAYNTSSGANASARFAVSGETGYYGSVAQFSTNATTMAGRTSVLGESPVGLTLAATNATGSINFITGALNDANERVRITSSGKVGIGTTTPSNFVDVQAGTLAAGVRAINASATLDSSANQLGYNFAAASAGSAAGYQIGAAFALNAGYTGSNLTAAMNFANNALGTGTTVLDTGAGVKANIGGLFNTTASTSGANAAGHAIAGGSTSRNYGLVGIAYANGGSPQDVGVYGTAWTDTGTPTANVGGMFTLYGSSDSIGTLTTAALIADNGSQAAPIFLARDNGTEVVRIADGGNVGIGTSTPAYRLDVAANTAGGVAQFSNANASGYAAADFTIAGTQRFSIGYCGAAQGLLQNNAYFYSQNSDLMIMVQDTAATSLRPSVTFKSAETAFNDNSQNIDFRVESDGNANMLFVDASQDSVSIGTTGATHTFNIGTGAASNFAVASGGRIHTYDGTAPTNGQVLIGDTALGNFAKATLTAGSGISITNGAGSITIAATGGGGGGSLNPVQSANLGPSGTNTRAYSTTYQNTTGVAIWVQIVISKTATGTLLAYADAAAAPVNANTALIEAWSIVGGYAATLGFYVPSGHYYKVRDDTTSTIGQWFEYQLLGSGNTPITTISTTTTLDATYYTVLCSATLTVNLPAAASSSGQVYNIKNIGSGTTITIDPNGAETIDGATTYTLTTQYQTVTIQSNGTAWFVL